MKAGQGNACKRQAGAFRSDGDHNCTFNFILYGVNFHLYRVLQSYKQLNPDDEKY